MKDISYQYHLVFYKDSFHLRLTFFKFTINILGGVREALFSDHNYEVLWGSRAGFAKVAVDAKVVNINYDLKIFINIFGLIKAIFKSVIPMFTENCREALRTFPFFKSELNFFKLKFCENFLYQIIIRVL